MELLLAAITKFVVRDELELNLFFIDQLSLYAIGRRRDRTHTA